MDAFYVGDVGDIESITPQALAIEPDNIVDELILDRLMEYFNDYKFNAADLEDYLDEKLNY